MPDNKQRGTNPGGEESGGTGLYPVIIVPGWGSPMFQMDWVARHLESEGLATIKLKVPRLAVGDMRESAEVLAREVERLRSENGVGKVNLVGYSLGGLIARIYLQELDGYRNLNRTVFVGAPQDGVYIGYLGAFTKSGRQVRRGSPFMRDLNMSGPCDCGERRCLSIYLTRDGTIVPSESARLACGYNLRLTWPVLHWGVVFNSNVIHTAAEFLKGRVPTSAIPGH
ncbi:MAG: alpha/beta fold hydrolase [Actinobacteria bacterium]|nr:alpha/beta fold hydrolase [Actinomycetota bacterium]